MRQQNSITFEHDSGGAHLLTIELQNSKIGIMYLSGVSYRDPLLSTQMINKCYLVDYSVQIIFFIVGIGPCLPILLSVCADCAQNNNLNDGNYDHTSSIDYYSVRDRSYHYSYLGIETLSADFQPAVGKLHTKISSREGILARGRNDRTQSVEKKVYRLVWSLFGA